MRGQREGDIKAASAALMMVKIRAANSGGPLGTPVEDALVPLQIEKVP